MKKYWGSGGIGDGWIVFLKLQNQKNIEWLHVESCDISKPLQYIKKECEKLDIRFSFECDPNYIENYKKEKWKDYIPVSSGIDGWCPLKGQTNIVLSDGFFYPPPLREIEYDYCIQVSGGAKNSRGWKFDPRILKKILTDKGYRVILVGTDLKYYDEKDPNNFVGKTPDVADTLALIRKSNTFIGLSGFLNYWACSMKIPNIFLEESPQHTARYFHKQWLDYAHSVKFGVMREILDLIRVHG